MLADTLQPAWVLHRRPYGDGGFLVELFTFESGRLTVLLRGAQRRSRGGNSGGLAQPFNPLLVQFAGRGELKTLRRIEAVSAGIPLQGPALFSGLYLNELLTRLLPRFDAHPALFARYGDTLPRLGAGDAEPTLRGFELALLDELGYGLAFARDAGGDPVSANDSYRLDPSLGFALRRFSSDADDATVSVDGATLLAIDDWWQRGSVLPERCLRPLKAITRGALASHLGDRPLRSRELFKAFMSGQSTAPSRTGTDAGADVEAGLVSRVEADLDVDVDADLNVDSTSC